MPVVPTTDLCGSQIQTRVGWVEGGVGQLSIFCVSKEEMLAEFEEYKSKTHSGWRCFNTNALLGKYERM